MLLLVWSVIQHWSVINSRLNVGTGNISDTSEWKGVVIKKPHRFGEVFCCVWVLHKPHTRNIVQLMVVKLTIIGFVEVTEVYVHCSVLKPPNSNLGTMF